MTGEKRTVRGLIFNLFLPPHAIKAMLKMFRRVAHIKEKVGKRFLRQRKKNLCDVMKIPGESERLSQAL